MFYIGGINETLNDYPDKDSIAVSLFFSGCTFNCIDCHNPELQNKQYGREVTSGMLSSYLSSFKNICLMGGEPLQQDIKELKQLVKEIMHTGHNICIYTGYTVVKAKEILGEDFFNSVTYIKCGQYNRDIAQESINNDSVFILASTNQQLYRYGKLITQNGIYYKKEYV